MKLEVDMEALKELCKKHGTRFADREKDVILGNNCGTVEIDTEYTTHKAYLEITGVKSYDEKEDISEFANAEVMVHEEIGRKAFPYLDVRSLSNSHSLDAGIEEDRKNKKLHMVTWLSVQTPSYFLRPNRPIERLGKPEIDFLLSKLNKFTDTNTQVYQNAIQQLSDSYFCSFLKGKSLEPALPYDVEKIFSK